MAFVVKTRADGGPAREYQGDLPVVALALALAAEPEAETYVCWEGLDEMCALDVDVETAYRVSDRQLFVLLETFQPRPTVAWTTHGGGVRLIYVASDAFSADEAAAVAALNWKLPYASLELKRETRHPLGPDRIGHRCGEVRWMEQVFEASAFRRHLGVLEVADAEVEAWLEEHGFQAGGRYDHALCPAAPSDRGGRQPVLVGDRGVHCFVCEADGLCLGSTRPGFFPYSHFCGQRRSTHLHRCLENATHWEHARFVLEHSVDLPPQFARLVYSAGVSMFRSRQEAKRAFATGRDFVRIGDRWTNLSAESYGDGLAPILAGLPACTYLNGEVDREGNPKSHVDKGRVVLFQQTFDLARYGYPSLVPVFGCRMWPHDPVDPGPVVKAVVQTRELAADEAVDLRPKYVSSADRMPEATMWTEFDRCFPGLNRPLLKLLIAARGVAEGACSMPPMLFLTGPTGASKTTIVFLAASVCGDRNTEVVWSANGDRMRQAILDAATVGTFVTFNEVLKEARSKVSDTGHAMDYVLNLTPDSVSHYMYVGPVRLGRLPVMVWTDTDLTPELKADAQLSRRMVHARLPAELDWETAWRRTGLTHAKSFRTSSEQRARACDALLSCVVDEYLRPPHEFSAIAHDLGFGRMRDSEEALERRSELQFLFDCVCRAPPVSGHDAVRWKGRGWTKVDRDVESELRDAWLAVADECFVSSRAASEVDWQRAVGLSEPALLEVRSHGQRVALRFRSAAGRRGECRVNGELRAVAGE